jgi:hypothetical protein
MLMANGMDLMPGNFDNHEEHLASHSAFQTTPEWTDIPEENKFKFEKHKQLHILAMQKVQQGGQIQMQGQELPMQGQPEEAGGMLAQPLQQFGGNRVESGAPPEEGGMLAPTPMLP